MGWFSSKREKSEAELSLEALERAAPDADDGDDADNLADLGILLTLTATPAVKTPGSPISVLNEQARVHPGDRVQLVTFDRTQETQIVSITRGGVPVDSLENDERGDIVLDTATELSGVYRTSCLQDPDSDDDWPEGWFSLQIQAFETRGTDLFVVGPTRGRITEGRRVTFEPAPEDDERTAKVKAIELQPDGRWGLLLEDAAAAGIEYGDELLHVRS